VPSSVAKYTTTDYPWSDGRLHYKLPGGPSAHVQRPDLCARWQYLSTIQHRYHSRNPQISQ